MDSRGFGREMDSLANGEDADVDSLASIPRPQPLANWSSAATRRMPPSAAWRSGTRDPPERGASGGILLESP